MSEDPEHERALREADYGELLYAKLRLTARRSCGVGSRAEDMATLSLLFSSPCAMHVHRCRAALSAPETVRSATA